MGSLGGAARCDVVLVAQGKGGTGKTSVATNLAAEWAAAGHKVLLWDLDPQGNATDLLGLDDNDRGESQMAMVTGRPASPVPARDGLDLVPGGEELDVVIAALAAKEVRRRDETIDGMISSVRATAAGYDLVVCDTAPAGNVIIDGLLTAADWLVIPTRPGMLDLSGLRRVAKRVGQLADSGRPVAELLGVVLFGLATRATEMRSETRAKIDELLTDTGAHVFKSVIRTSERGAVDQAENSLMAGEYQAAAAALGRRRFAAGAEGLADDYHHLAEEVLAAIASRRAQTKEGAA